jgi:hypothetical protein
MSTSLAALNEFRAALGAVRKSVKIEIADNDLETLKINSYKLCFAKKVGNNDYNVVWQSSNLYLANNTFSWTPQYQLFGSNIFSGNVSVNVSTNLVTIELGETSVLNKSGILLAPKTAGATTCFTMDNQFGSIHPGVSQLCAGLDGTMTSSPIYVATNAVVSGPVELTPVEKVLVWFEQDIETSTMFSTARSRSVEMDLTEANTARYRYAKETWNKM